ncbi:MAG: hypothetical protein IKY94_11325 [Lachnospiraceae bacterium]|nr:hypothetical protein [Lachnospiraceae bacterium]
MRDQFAEREREMTNLKYAIINDIKELMGGRPKQFMPFYSKSKWNRADISYGEVIVCNGEVEKNVIWLPIEELLLVLHDVQIS